MAQPLDYRSPKDSGRSKQSQSAPKQPARAVIPIEFDMLLTRTDDHATARAIQLALEHDKIPVHAGNDFGQVGRTVELHIRSADKERATQIALGIFIRRKKIKSHPRPQLPPDEYWQDPSEGTV